MSTTILLELARGAALLLALTLLIGLNTRAWPGRRRAEEFVAGTIFGGICIIGMSMPITVDEGVIFDARSAVLAMAGLFGTALTAVVAALIAATYRAWLGGGGAAVGVAVVFASVTFGMLYRHAHTRGWIGRGPLHYLALGALVHLVAIGLFTQLPAVHAAQIFGELALPYVIILTLTTALLGILLEDLDNRLRTQDALAHSEARLRAITDSIPDVMLLVDEDGRYLEVLSSDEKLLHVDAVHLIGKSIHDALAPTEAERFMTIVRDAIQQNQIQTIEYPMKTLDGQTRHFEGRCKRLDTPIDGRRAALFIARDISERVAADEERRIAAIAFESQQGMAIADTRSRFLKVNKAFCAISGYTEDELIGERTSKLSSGRHDRAFYREMWRSIARTGVWSGEIWDRRKNGEVYPAMLTINAVRDALGHVTHYVAAVTDITARKRNEEEIHTLAFYDTLTHLPNRRLLIDRLERALVASGRSGHHGALMFIDLDDFKNINDLLGHHNGDILLQAAARRLLDAVRETDTVARFGGDEFVIMLEQLNRDAATARGEAQAVAEKALRALKAPYVLDEEPRHSSASIGVVLFYDDQVTVDDLLKHADLSMYESKHEGKGRIRFYDPSMQEAVTSRLRLEDEIRDAIRDNGFHLLYQPQFNEQGHLIGAEALLRWNHRLKGDIRPDDFIPVAERAGLMPLLGARILGEACEQLASWAQRPVTARLTLAVNISAQQLYHPDFVDGVIATLERTGAPAHRLTLELTESLLLDDMEEATRRMNLLRQQGIRFSIDDFGTGYSSLAYLERLPLDELKIDRSFVGELPANPNSLAIIKAIIAVADSLGLSVIAEGVEHEPQRTLLCNVGCKHFQGFLLGRPMPASTLVASLFER